jgi:fructoselysine-6-P-deglycase FrlB-like protein
MDVDLRITDVANNCSETCKKKKLSRIIVVILCIVLVTSGIYSSTEIHRILKVVTASGRTVNAINEEEQPHLANSSHVMHIQTPQSNCTFTYALSHNTRVSVCRNSLGAVLDIRRFVNDRPTIQGIVVPFQEYILLDHFWEPIQHDLLALKSELQYNNSLS